MEIHKGVKCFCPTNIQEWRNWLSQNHTTEKNIWIICYKKKSNQPSLAFTQLLDEALCFGWIDSKSNSRDEESYYRFFAKRNPKSNWSKLNKEKIEKLLLANKMAESGLEMIQIAKETGTWTALDEVEKLIIPEDLQVEFDKNLTAFEFYQQFPRSSKRAILEWIFMAKRASTRVKRIQKTVELAAQNIRANG